MRWALWLLHVHNVLNVKRVSFKLPASLSLLLFFLGRLFKPEDLHVSQDLHLNRKDLYAAVGYPAKVGSHLRALA